MEKGGHIPIIKAITFFGITIAALQVSIQQHYIQISERITTTLMLSEFFEAELKQIEATVKQIKYVSLMLLFLMDMGMFEWFMTSLMTRLDWTMCSN